MRMTLNTFWFQGIIFIQSITGVKTPECLLGSLKAHRKLSLSSLMMGTVPQPCTHIYTYTHPHYFLPLLAKMCYSWGQILCELCLTDILRSHSAARQGTRAIVKGFYLFIYLFPLPKRGETCWWWGYEVTRNPSSTGISIGSVISNHWERPAWAWKEMGERQAYPKIAVFSSPKTHYLSFRASSSFCQIPIVTTGI